MLTKYCTEYISNRFRSNNKWEMEKKKMIKHMNFKRIIQQVSLRHTLYIYRGYVLRFMISVKRFIMCRFLTIQKLHYLVATINPMNSVLMNQ